MADDKLEMKAFPGARPDEKIIRLQGVLNAETAFRFRDFVRENDAPTLILDMSYVRSLDSSGLGVLIGIYASCERNGHHILLAGLNDRIWDLFRMCKIESVFTRYHSVAEAEQAAQVSAESGPPESAASEGVAPESVPSESVASD